jgi:hypothetical protein
VTLSRRLVLACGLAVAAQSATLALNLAPTRTDIERALSLARWTHTDAERAQFHSRYVFTLKVPPVDFWTVEQIEVTTEFRRLELMAEEHTRANDLWGRGGLRDVDEAIRPYRGRVTITARLALRSTLPYIGRAPLADVALGGLEPIDLRREDVYAYCAGDFSNCPIVGGVLHATYDAAEIGQSARSIQVIWNGRELGRVDMDFARIE